LNTLLTHNHLIPPHGGELVDLNVGEERAAELKAQSRHFPSWDLTARQVCDLELLLSGAFSPLRGFMTKADYESVCYSLRLTTEFFGRCRSTLDVSGTSVQVPEGEEQENCVARCRGSNARCLERGRCVQPDRKVEAAEVLVQYFSPSILALTIY
jgi:sulfate adenylyltransferase